MAKRRRLPRCRKGVKRACSVKQRVRVSGYTRSQCKKFR